MHEVEKTKNQQSTRLPQKIQPSFYPIALMTFLQKNMHLAGFYIKTAN